MERIPEVLVSGGSNRPKRYFVKGPIPLAWLAKAAVLPGKALHVAVLICFLRGLCKSDRIKISHSVLETFGVSRQACARGLTAMEKAGLIRVERHIGRNPKVTILDFKL